MACRLVNLHQHPLRIDLRGGETLVLAPGQTSRVLREELLYDNSHLGAWESAGWIARVPTRLGEAESAAGAAAKPAAKPAREPAKSRADEPPKTAGDTTARRGATKA